MRVFLFTNKQHLHIKGGFAMSRIAAAVKETRTKTKEHAVTNFMNGTSYELNPLETMKMVTASSIFGEPSYYRDNGEGTYHVDTFFQDYLLPCMKSYESKSTTEIMENAIDNALAFDFEAAIRYAITLRTEYLMRFNPQIIMVRAACMTDERIAFTKDHPGEFARINEQVMSRADDALIQMTYYLYTHDGSKQNIPGILKRSWQQRLSKLTPYEINKYRNAELGLINGVRICHANNKGIDELMTTGSITVKDAQKTWQEFRIKGESWQDLMKKTYVGHMALLKNIRGIASECTDLQKPQFLKETLTQLKNGVSHGKQFPYRYLSAYKALDKPDTGIKTSYLGEIKDTLEECMDIACENLPKLPGRNAFLSDNSGSAWGAFPSEYGTMTVAEIGNLSSVIGAVNSDESTIYAFGDRLLTFPVSKRNGILTQAKQISRISKRDVGISTEAGIWFFFRDAIDKKEHFDNIFIYSDMQAGHGGLYGTSHAVKEYQSRGFLCGYHNVDVAKLIQTYRSQVNPKVNVYCIQTAGYDNVLVPENGYRTNILYGWTGKELVYADAMNRFWDAYDKQKENRQ